MVNVPLIRKEDTKLFIVGTIFISMFIVGLVEVINKIFVAIEWIISTIDWAIVEDYLINFFFNVDIIQVIAIIMAIKLYMSIDMEEFSSD